MSSAKMAAILLRGKWVKSEGISIEKLGRSITCTVRKELKKQDTNAYLIMVSSKL